MVCYICILVLKINSVDEAVAIHLHHCLLKTNSVDNISCMFIENELSKQNETCDRLHWYINVCLLRMNSVDKVKYSTHDCLLRMNPVDNDSGANHLHLSLLKSNPVNQYVANQLQW